MLTKTYIHSKVGKGAKPLPARTRTLLLILVLFLIIVFCSSSTTARTQELISPATQTETFNDLYDEVWLLVNDYFLYSERLSSWNAWRHRFDGSMHSIDDAEQKIERMLDSLCDEYTFYRNEGATNKRRQLTSKTNVVSYRMLPGRIGYLHIETFNSEHTVNETEKALLVLSRASAYILDLRQNGGGCIDSAFETFALFNREGLFASMKGRERDRGFSEELRLESDSAITVEQGRELRMHRKPNCTGNKPLIVLTDATTKSAAEMLAGALRDNGRALIVGKRTYGKGIVQRVWELPENTSIKIASAKFFLPSGLSIHKTGLKPDIEVELTAGEIRAANRDHQLSLKSRIDFPYIQSNQFKRVQRHDKLLAQAYKTARQRLITLARP